MSKMIDLSSAHRRTAAAHSTLPHANPLAVSRVAALLEMLAARSPKAALDVGCGPGTLALALASLTQVKVTGIDLNECFLVRARSEASRRVLRGEATFELMDAARLPSDLRFDAILCVGASQAFGTPREAVAACAKRLAPGGALLFADLAWAHPPANEFLGFLGMKESDLQPVEIAATKAFEDAGLAVVHVERASRQDWSSYEAGILAGRLSHAGRLAGAEAAELAAQAHAWADAAERWGDAFAFFATLAVAR